MTSDQRVQTVDDLAQAIRCVDGRHDLGAGALAEALWPTYAALLHQLAAREAEVETLSGSVRALMDDYTRASNARDAAERAREEVTEDMVDRALVAFTNYPIPRGNYGENSEREMIRAALTAALKENPNGR